LEITLREIVNRKEIGDIEICERIVRAQHQEDVSGWGDAVRRFNIECGFELPVPSDTAVSGSACCRTIWKFPPSPVLSTGSLLSLENALASARIVFEPNARTRWSNYGL
jgi:hypothetical protein